MHFLSIEIVVKSVQTLHPGAKLGGVVAMQGILRGSRQ